MFPLFTRISVLFCLALTIFSFHVNGSEPAEPSTPYVVLISLDGFRHDYIELHDAKALKEIASKGVRATAMQPVYPANTFPNHISLITGLLPIHHGIVNNAFYDKQRPSNEEGYARYRMGAAYKDSTWITAVPLYNLVEFHGKKAATFFWPESDARVNGILPSYHYHYSKYADYQQRVDQMVDWLSLPEAQRPHFIAGYFSLTDSVGHKFGPYSSEIRDAVQRVDGLIGQLYQRLQALPFAVNLVIVSDHGMTEVNPDAQINLPSLNISDAFIVENEGVQLHLYAKPQISQQEIDQQVMRLAKLEDDRFSVLSDSQREARHYSYNSRTGDIVLETVPPYVFKDEKYEYKGYGGHGYLNTHPDMGAIFIASGPAFKHGKQLPEFSNLEVYPALAHIMGLSLLSPIDGKLDVLKQALSDDENE